MDLGRELDGITTVSQKALPPSVCFKLFSRGTDEA